MHANNIAILYVSDEQMINPCLNVMISDFETVPNYYRITEKASNNWFLEILKKNKIQKLTRGVFNLFLEKTYSLGKALEELSPKFDKVYTIFLNGSVASARYPVTIFQYYRSKYKNVKYVLIYIDAIVGKRCHDADRLRKAGAFDLVYSFDKQNALKYEMKHWHSPYSKIPIDNQETQYSLYLCCDAYTRRHKIIQILEACKDNEIEPYFHLRCNDSQTAEIFRNISKYIDLYGDSWLPYEQVVQESIAANCILEIVRPGQVGLTLRSYEAVCYNRKLLTNNKGILDFEFYDPRYMQYFEKVEDIDWDWVREEIEVDYHYNGEFSPLRLLEDIIKSCEEK